MNLPDNASIHAADCPVWTSADPADKCDCAPVRLADSPTMRAAIEYAYSADAPSEAELSRRENAPIDSWQRAQDAYERQLYGGEGW